MHFGILKGRFRILMTGIRLHRLETADKIWATCCALHNWLLEVDKSWQSGVPSDWEGALGELDATYVNVPDATLRLYSPVAARQFDVSALGNGNVDIGGVQPPIPPTGIFPSDGIQQVRQLSLAIFRGKLVTHFDIAFQRNEVAWPTRYRVPEPATGI